MLNSPKSNPLDLQTPKNFTLRDGNTVEVKKMQWREDLKGIQLTVFIDGHPRNIVSVWARKDGETGITYQDTRMTSPTNASMVEKLLAELPFDDQSAKDSILDTLNLPHYSSKQKGPTFRVE